MSDEKEKKDKSKEEEKKKPSFGQIITEISKVKPPKTDKKKKK